MPFPQTAEGEVLVKVRRIGICGTDLHALEGTQPYFTYPRILGHELAGEVMESAHGFSKGDMVSVIPYRHCGWCTACKQGRTNCCVQMQVYGVHIDGGMRSCIAVPAEGLLRTGELDMERSALIEPLAIAAHGVNRAAVKPGEYVAVIGAGPIGLGLMEWARLAGGRVIAVDTHAQRLRFCNEHIPICASIDAKKENLYERLGEITHGNMPEVIIDASGNREAINRGFSLMSHGGRYVLVGLQKEDIVFSHPEFHKREGSLLSSRNATRADFEQVADTMLHGRLKPEYLITHRVPFEELAEYMKGWMGGANGVIKGMAVLE
jgi:2-desacetyl-2-hydroxyethyl bacteriochlorophyllide A dehydrogenase